MLISTPVSTYGRATHPDPVFQNSELRYTKERSAIIGISVLQPKSTLLTSVLTRRSCLTRARRNGIHFLPGDFPRKRRNVRNKRIRDPKAVFFQRDKVSNKRQSRRLVCLRALGGRKNSKPLKLSQGIWINT